MRLATKLILMLALAAGPACTAQVSEAAPSGWVEEGNVEDGAFDRPGRPKNFLEVNSTHTSNSFRQTVNRALRVLAEDESELAQLTWESIRQGRVRIDELADLTCNDYMRVLKDYEGSDLGLTTSDFTHLREDDSEAHRKLTESIYGYQWSNRIYVTQGQSAEQLASTLVHEVNHVLNHSDAVYYDNLPTSGFIEEYRAFTAERRFRPDHWRGVNMIDYVCENYEWDRALIDPAVIARPLSDQMLPTEENWARRRIQDDPIEDDRACVDALAN